MKKKKTFFNFFSFIITIIAIQGNICIAQIPNLMWAKGIGGSGYDLARDITTDTSGKIITTGFFEGNVDFDPGIGTFFLSSSGDLDIFVSKVNSNPNDCQV